MAGTAHLSAAAPRIAGAPDLPRPVRALALVALSVLLALSLGTLLAVALRANLGQGLRPADMAAVRFTLLQAGLSALLSTLLAVPLARALARRNFPGRTLLITLLGAPFILPVIVAVLGLLAVFGRAGVLNAGLGALGFAPVSIYGLHGVVLAHVFFNLPLATRLFLQGWAAIPAERFRLAAAMGFPPGAVLRHLEWPMLRSVAPGAFLVVFLVCLTSFAIALTLGGGPRATTVELAIYQAFTFDFDLGRAARLALIQLAIAAAMGAVAFAAAMPEAFGGGLDRRVERWDARAPLARGLDAFAIVLAALFLVLPMIMILANGAAHVATLPVSVFLAALRSLAVSLGAVAILLALALPLALWAAARGRGWAEGAGLLMIAASPLVMGTGLFLIVFPLADPRALALPVTALVNAAAAIPFALRALVPAIAKVRRDHGRLAAALAMPPGAWLWLIVLPRIRRPLGFAAGLTAAFSMGDLGVITLFAGSDAPTLPLMIYRLMGAYRMDQAAGAALVLLVLSLALFWAFDRGGRADA